MGNVPPVPANPPTGRPSAASGEHQPKNAGGKRSGGGELVGAPPNPPNGWSQESDNHDFIQVSPQSDLSNPSQFRHRIVKNNKTPIQDRKRTSKVISKEIPMATRRCQTYVRSNTLPAPQAFYFERHIRGVEDDNDDDDCDNNNNENRPAPALPRVSGAVDSGGGGGGGGGDCIKKKNWALHTNKVKEKAGRAKRMLQGCWDEQMQGGCMMPEKSTDHEQLKTLSPVVVVPEARPLRKSNNNMDNNKKVSAAQFSPAHGIPQQVIFQPYHTQQQDMTQLTQTCIGDVRTYLHDEKGYVDRLAADDEQQIPTPRPNANPAASYNNNKKLLGEEDRIDGSVVALFDTNKQGKAQRKSSTSPAKRKKKSSSATGTTTRTSISEAIQAQIDSQLQRNDKNNKRAPSRSTSHQSRDRSPSRTMHQRVSSTSADNHHREPLAQKTNNHKDSTTTTRGRMSSRDGELKRRSASSLICRSKAGDHMKKDLQQQQTDPGRAEARRVSLEKIEHALESPDTYSSGSTLFSQTPTGDKENNFSQRASSGILVPDDRRTSLATCNTLIGATVSDMLIQTYPIANAFTDPRLRYSAARYLTGNYATSNLLEEEADPTSYPLDSDDEGLPTPVGKSPKPLLSEQVTTNAAFLFSPSYHNGDGAPKVIKPAPRNDSSSFNISTKESRNRLSGWTSSTSNQHSRPDTVRVSIDEASNESDPRRVRFSGSDQIFTLAKEEKYRSHQKQSPGELVYIPPIESKLSDLTDTSGLPNAPRRESVLSVASSTTTYSSKVHSIPEETGAADDDDETTATSTSPSNESCATKKSSLISTNNVQEPAPPQSADTSAHLHVSEYRVSNTQALPPPPKKNWSYGAGDNSMDNGVTPLRSGKSSYNATSSPYLRFNEAKNKFAGKNNATAKVQPVKGPAHSVKKISRGLVQKRVVAMEEKVRNNSTTRRDTIGHRAIAPRKGSLVSSAFRTNTTNPHAIVNSNHAGVQKTTTVFKHRSLDTNNAKQPTYVTRTSKSSSDEGAGYDTDGTDDPYGQIMYSNPIDEGSSDEEATCDYIVKDVMSTQKAAAPVANADHDSSECETEEDDDFAALLQYQSSLDDDESYDGETVSTVRQQPRKIEYMLSRGSSVVSSQRPSIGSSSSASTSVGPSVATVRQNRQSLVSTSESTTLSYALKKENIALAFRHEAPVKPNEQTHRAPPGALCLSPMQRTPMQARKWRALAAAAQEKESKRNFVGQGSKVGGLGVRKSLSERSNTMHNKY